jgi:hypothetical protein
MRKNSVLTLLVLASLPLAAQAQVTHIRSVSLEANDKPVSIQVPKFEGELGQLAGVQIDIKTKVIGSVDVENLGSEARTAVVQAYFGTAVYGLNDILLFSSGDFSQVHRFHPHDGNVDYAGPSGAVLGFEGSTHKVSLEISPEWADMRPFVMSSKNGRMLDLTAQSVGNYELQGLRHVAAQLGIKVELTLSVTYLVVRKTDDYGQLGDLPGNDIIKPAALGGQRDDRNNYTPPVAPAPAVKPRDYGQKI